MSWLKEVIGTEKAIIAMCHMQAMPGDPGYDKQKGMNWVVDKAREDFLALDPEAVFSEEMVSSIVKADISGLEPSMAGFTMTGDIGEPAITFGLVNGEFQITGINY